MTTTLEQLRAALSVNLDGGNMITKCWKCGRSTHAAMNTSLRDERVVCVRCLLLRSKCKPQQGIQDETEERRTMSRWSFFILRCLALEIPPKRIARYIGCSQSHVYWHLQKLRVRYGVSQSRELVARVLEGKGVNRKEI